MPSVPASAPEPRPDPISGPGLGARFGLDERASLAMCLVDPSGFDTGTVVELLVRVDAEQARWAAARVRLLAELSARDASHDKWVAEEVGAALRLSPTRAMTQVKDAAQLHDELPRMFDELAAGRVTAGQARLAVDASYRLPSAAAVAALDVEAAARCGDLSEPQTRHLLRRQVLRVDPAGAERRHRRATADRYVRLTEAEDGMALLTAFLPAPQPTACMQRLDEAARQRRQAVRQYKQAVRQYKKARRGTPDALVDPRTLDQLRADLFSQTLLTGGGAIPNTANSLDGAASGMPADPTSPAQVDCGSGSDGVGLAASVNVIVSASTLLGQDDEPGWLDRYGPITAETARRVAHDPTATWRRLVTDPVTGQVTDVGTRRYRPPAPVRRHVELRDGTCRFPYCTHPATGCDLDHAVLYPQGPTVVGNLHSVSRRHHRAKTHTPWRVTLDPNTGQCTWTSPTGRRTITKPPQRWTLPEDTPARRDNDQQRRKADQLQPGSRALPDDPPF